MNKRERQLQSNLFKNYQIFQRLRLGGYPSKFGNMLTDLRIKYSQDLNQDFVYFKHFKNLKELEKYENKIQKERQNLFEIWSEKKIKTFNNDIWDCLHEFTLGSEWFDTIANLALFHFIVPPKIDLTISKVENEKKKSIIIEIGPETKASDLGLVIDKIKDFQKSLWPKYKKTKFSPTFLNDLKEYTSFRATKYNKHRDGIRESQTDKSTIAEFYDDFAPKEVDQKRLNRIKQIRKRLKGDNI